MSALFVFLRKFHAYYEMFFGFWAYVLNVLVLFLVFTKSQKFTRHYRRILLLNCIVDICFTTATLVTLEIPEIMDDKIFMITDGFTPKSWSIYASIFWIFALYMTVVNVPMQFLSRYSAVCLTTPYSSLQYYSIYILSTLYVAGHAGFMYLTFDHEGNSSKMEHYAKMLRQNKMFEDDKSISFVVGDASNLMTAIHFTDALIIMSVAYGVVAFTGYKIWDTLAKKKHLMSKSTLTAHQHLTKILILQACYPFATVALPLFVANFLPVFKVKTMYLGYVMDLIGTLIPTLNAASVLIIIPSYRRYLCGWIMRHTNRTGILISTNHSESHIRSQLPSTKQDSNSPQRTPSLNQVSFS